MGFVCAILPVASSPVCLCSVPDVKTVKGHFYTLIHPRITEAQGAEFSGAERHSSYDVGNRRRALKVTLSITGACSLKLERFLRALVRIHLKLEKGLQDTTISN